MDHPRDYLPTLDRIEAALDAACGALVTLESTNPGEREGFSDVEGMHRHIGLGIRSLREAIEELRLAQSNGSSALAIGFVLKGKHSRAARQRQARPRSDQAAADGVDRRLNPAG